MNNSMLNISLYPNLLDSIAFDYLYAENIIKDYTLIFPQTRNQKVEWGIRFPVFLYAFYDFLQKHQYIPKQEEFYHCYLHDNASFFSSSQIDSEIMSGLRARIFRTYPSLVRDIHFALFIKNTLPLETVIYNQSLDVEDGIDLIIIHNEIPYAINLYTNTRRAYLGREKKKYRHSTYSNIKYVELPVDFKGSKQIGRFFLYAEREKDAIKNIMGIK